MIISPDSFNQGISPEQYLDLLYQYAEEGKSSGRTDNEALIHYTKLNAQRTRRWQKTLKLQDTTIEKLAEIKESTTWVILTETWCGDAANSLPVIFKMAEVNPLISTKILFRDDNPELMDKFLTKGGRSIPKLISLDTENRVIYDWGPRPEAAQLMYWEWKSRPNGTKYDEFQVTLQKWYNEDKGETLQEEWIKLQITSEDRL